MATVYLETTIVSYLTSRASERIIPLSRQLLTRKWWDEERQSHELFVSQFVLDEASQGDSDCIQKRQEALAGIALLAITPEIFELARELTLRSVLPPAASLDALHISTAAVHSVEYLLTWNCKHIANADILPRTYRTIEDLGFKPPLICTIEEMIGDNESIT